MLDFLKIVAGMLAFFALILLLSYCGYGYSLQSV